MAEPAGPSAGRVVPAVLGVLAVLAAAALAVAKASPEDRTPGSTAAGDAMAGDAKVGDARPSALAAVLSPDGSRVAVAADTPGSDADELYLVRADGSDLRGVATGMTFYSTGPLAFDSSGGQILFVGYEPGNDQLAVFRVRVDGQGQTRLADFSGSLPAFSPDGADLAFSVAEPDGGGEDLYVSAVDGSGRRALTSMAGEEYGPAYSPDGKLLAFEHRQSPELPSVWVVRADGSDARRLTPADAPASSPHFTADGKRVVFTSGVDDSAPEYGAYSVAVTSPGAPERYEFGRSAVNERAGRRVYVEDGDAWIENLDGSDRRRLTTWR